MEPVNPTLLVVAGAFSVIAGSFAVLFLLTGDQPVTWDRVVPIVGLPTGCYFLILARRNRREGIKW